MSPRARRAFGVAELGKKSGSDDGAPASLLGTALLFLTFLKALPRWLPRVAESGAKSGLPVLLPACGVAFCEFGARRGEDEGKARGEDERGRWLLAGIPKEPLACAAEFRGELALLAAFPEA